MSGLPLEIAYPGLAFRPRTRGWWARLLGAPAECIHLEQETDWMALLAPDVVYLCGKPHWPRATQRPEVSLCRNCFLAVVRPELESFSGRVVAFEPDGEVCSQYFFLERDDFAAAGLQHDVRKAIEQRLAERAEGCAICSRSGRWLWLSRREVGSLDEAALIAAAPGRWLCAGHGAAALCASLTELPEANLLYVNVPYGAAGAYVWI
ncbi:MAG: hypothetical protein K6U02_07440 [Firmicutes bacterium]|nr:hypothetical protein [Bacillota bacterium]